MKIGIIGAGIGGLTTAIFLEKFGFHVDVFEQSPELKAVGAGIILAHNAGQVYQKLGLYQDIRDLGMPLNSVNVCQPNLAVISATPSSHFDQKFSVNSIAIKRGALQSLLLGQLKRTSIYLDKKLVSIEDSRQPSLHFADGSHHNYDLIIGADGLRSVVRNHLFDQVELRDANQCCWRGMTAMILPKQFCGELNELWGNGSRFGFVQVSESHVYWYALKNKSDNDIAADLASLFNQYHPIVAKIISKTSSKQIIQNDIQDLSPLNSWTRNNIVLLGDAAHATTPNLGQGACQAIEDAYVLSHLIAKHKSNDALSAYQKLRQKKANRVVRLSWQLGKISQIESPLLQLIRNFTLRSMPNRLNQLNTEKLYTINTI